MTQNEIKQDVDKYVLHTYNRFPIAIDHGNGVRVYDADGKEYLDFMAGIAVYALGYHFPGYDEALTDQLLKTIHTSNLYYTEEQVSLAKLLLKKPDLLLLTTLQLGTTISLIIYFRKVLFDNLFTKDSN